MTHVWDGFPGGGSELLALLALADWSDDNGRCYPAMSSIAKKIRLKERQAQRVIHQLVADGFVQVVGNEFGGAPGTSRQYRLILSRLTGVTHDTPTGVAHDTRTSSTGVMEDGDGCHGRRLTGVTHDTLTVIEPSLTVNVPVADEKPSTPAAQKKRFPEFWDVWPSSSRKVAKFKCAEIWKRHKLDSIADTIIAHVTAMKTTEQWSTGFEPAPTTYLSQRRWEDSDSAPAQPDRNWI